MRKSFVRIATLFILFVFITVSVVAETATLTVASSLDACKVKIDDKDMGTTPLVIQIAPGPHKIFVSDAKGKTKFEETIELQASDRAVAYADFKASKIDIYKTEKEIQDFVTKAANFVKFNEFFEKANKLHEEKKLDWAIDALEKAISFYPDKDAKELLITWRIERLPEGFVYLRGGKFKMGQTVKVFPDDYRQVPEHEIIVSDFAIATFEVTNDDFAKFVEATKHKTTVENIGGGSIWDKKTGKWEFKKGVSWKSPTGRGSSIRGKGKFPVCQISWPDADTYCIWRCSVEGVPEGTIRLPTEAEWEYAARGKDGRPFPWGEEPPFKAGKDSKYAVVDAKWSKAVGKIEKGKSPEGVYDLIGNVWEWCYDRGDDTYYQTCKDKGTVKDPMGPPFGDLRAVRGGGYDSDPDSARSTKRYFVKSDNSSTNLGFRLVFVF